MSDDADFEKQIQDASVTLELSPRSADGLLEQLRTVNELLGALPAPPAEACLVYRDPSGAVHSRDIGAGLIFGRSADCDISFPDRREVSKRHFAIEVSGPDYILRDLDSTNGVLVNSGTEPVRERTLADGDLIGVAAFRFAFLRAAPEAAPPSP